MSLTKVGSSVIKGDVFNNEYETITTSSTAIITTDFDLYANATVVYIEGVRQQESAYSITGARQITLSETVIAGTPISVISIEPDGIQAMSDKADKVTGMVSGNSQVYNGSLWVPSQSYRKNFIINGDARIWQRGIAKPMAAGNSYYLADRFKVTNQSDGALSYFQSQSIPTFAQCNYVFTDSIGLQVVTPDTSIAAGQYVGILQTIEGYTYRGIHGKTATLSFWVRSSKTGIHCVAFRSGSPTDRSYVAEYTVNAVDTWEKKVVTVTFNQEGALQFTTGPGLQVWWSTCCGSTYHTTGGAWQTGNYLTTANQVNLMDTTGDALRIVGILFEIGSVATDFPYTHITEELDLCQRYYEHSYAAGSYPGAGGGLGFTRRMGASVNFHYDHANVRFRITKKETPVVTLYSYYNANTTGVMSREGGTDAACEPYTKDATGFGVYSPSSAFVAGLNYLMHWTAEIEV